MFDIDIENCRKTLS